MLDSREKKILSAFDRPGAGALPLRELGDFSEIRGVAGQLAKKDGCALPQTRTLSREPKTAACSSPPLAMSLSIPVPDATSAEEAKSQIAPLLKEFGARLTEIDIDDDPELRARYGYDVPVIFLGARKAAKHRVDLTQFRRQLRDASRES